LRHLFESPARNSRAFVILGAVIFPSKRSHTNLANELVRSIHLLEHILVTLWEQSKNRYYASQTLEMMSS
ncbi:hypothetical protein, partial [Vibrio parahaemolyticus]|uniref:hypothetical protein n=1 Tax=Vibrio parahaemolyticus TaxID=670 RepID=UPI00356B75D1